MPRLPKFRDTVLNTRDLLVTAGPVVLIALALLLLAYWALDPTPPKRLILATGPEQGAYAEFGQRYKAHLQRYGIEVELRQTQGSSENLKLLQDPASGVDFAFVQGGAGRLRRTEEGPPEGLVSLGSLFYEPVWLFYREAAAKQKLGKAELENLAQLEGWRVNIGAPGSGVTNLMLRLFDANGIAPEELTVQRLGNTPAVVSLLDGQTDALIYVSAPESPLVQMLLLTPGIGLMHFEQAEAYSRRLPVVSPVLLPQGVVRLGENVPAEDVRLLAPTAMLVSRDGAHPALQQLFVQAAHAIHGGAGWFQKRGEFPTPRGGELPLAKEAERFFQSGPPFLQRYLPFWLANLIDRMWVVLASIIVVLIPLSRVVPPLYELRVRSRVFRWYARLRQIEEGLADEPHGTALPQGARGPQGLMDELDALDAKVKQLQVPLSHADELYALRSHIDLVRKKLRALGAQTPNPTAS